MNLYRSIPLSNMTRLFQQSAYTFRVQTLSASLFEAVWVDILYWCAFHLIRPLRYTKEGRVQRPSINGADNRLDIFSSTSPRSNSKRERSRGLCRRKAQPTKNKKIISLITISHRQFVFDSQTTPSVYIA
uniref:Uncharacterized protein n=1 Tax=Daphnia magna TaxID=35525 RepID=A0A0P6I7J5_9CRUS